MIHFHLESTRRRPGLGRCLAALVSTAGVLFSSAAAQASDVGALVTFQANTTAKAAEVNQNFDDVKTAVNTKQDEATATGIEFSDFETSQTLDTTATQILSINLTIPASGFVVVDFDTQSFINHVTGTSMGLSCTLKRNGTSIRTRNWNTDDGDPTGGRNLPMHLTYARAEATAGTVTYSVDCLKQGALPAQVSNYSLVATYTEHRY